MWARHSCGGSSNAKQSSLRFSSVGTCCRSARVNGMLAWYAHGLARGGLAFLALRSVEARILVVLLRISGSRIMDLASDHRSAFLEPTESQSILRFFAWSRSGYFSALLDALDRSASRLPGVAKSPALRLRASHVLDRLRHGARARCVVAAATLSTSKGPIAPGWANHCERLPARNVMPKLGWIISRSAPSLVQRRAFPIGFLRAET
jgi:hypothetical protein